MQPGGGRASRGQADAARVRQCLENIVSNAVRYSPAQAPVEIAVSVRHRDGQTWVAVEVCDEGPGIPAELLLCLKLPGLVEQNAPGALP